MNITEVKETVIIQKSTGTGYISGIYKISSIVWMSTVRAGTE